MDFDVIDPGVKVSVAGKPDHVLSVVNFWRCIPQTCFRGAGIAQ
jgi:hypothetical protein